MIPKPGKDAKLLKSWRPIVLSNTTGKLLQKGLADQLQSHPAPFHHLQYGSRKGRSAIDANMITITKVQRAIHNGHRATLLGKDIVSAFNHLRRQTVLDIIAFTTDLPILTSNCADFLNPRSFQVNFNGASQGEGKMIEGACQGSPPPPNPMARLHRHGTQRGRPLH